ncbi:DUF3108 domain-containing protein [Rhodanobacter sp. PCA2]|uniref:DUF3108 domain-containing protein n=1 Tax=Rhodanobacter sp. PCA2 TaxID=2006117 RepID=UPI0015E745DD|nr:DUF3108 domain-containing protein [Rhodanobacter sp. PCA2]MBA2079216.1 hypothetical protein [Rhodanobacter sp. PCA2]
MNPRTVLACTVALLLTTGSALAATVPAAFTAHYKVTQGGQPMGEATVTLRPGADGTWLYRKDVKGTGGLAALLGASTQETSSFRWKGKVPEAIGYDYRLVAAGKNKQRHLHVDWPKQQVSVDEGKGVNTYPAQPGMVERNTLPLAVGLALAGGGRQISLPVAVRQKVETEDFKVAGSETVQVPAGSFKTQRVERSDAAREFSAWYAPGRYPLPVKLAQHDGGDLVLELESFSRP